MSDFIRQLSESFGTSLIQGLAAVGILILGWIVALIGARLVQGLLRRVHLDRQVNRFVRGSEKAEAGAEIPVETWISRAVFWLIILFTVVGFLQVLNLAVVADPIRVLLQEVLGFVPAILGALVLLFLAWLVASALRFMVIRVLDGIRLDQRLASEAELEAPEHVSVSETLGNVVYWLIFLLFLPAILGALQLQGLLQPVTTMVEGILGFLPNLLGAAVILAVGWLAARIVRQIVVNLLAGVGLDQLGQRTGVSTALGQRRLSEVVGTILYVLILIPVVIAALQALNIPAVSGPAANMLSQLLGALPAIFGAFLLLGIAYFVARLVSTFATSVLTNIGFDRVFTWIGLYPESEGAPEGPSRLTPSELVGYLTTVGIMLFAALEASELLGFAALADLVSRFISAATQVLVGLVIFGLGLYLASLAERVIRSAGGSQAHILAPAARVAIIIFSGALALQEVGIGEDIVRLAFGFLVGAVAVAVALAFGLGGRDIAARQLERWRRALGGLDE